MRAHWGCGGGHGRLKLGATRATFARILSRASTKVAIRSSQARDNHGKTPEQIGPLATCRNWLNWSYFSHGKLSPRQKYLVLSIFCEQPPPLFVFFGHVRTFLFPATGIALITGQAREAVAVLFIVRLRHQFCRA